MDVEYTLTEEDYLQLNLHANSVVPGMKRHYVLTRWVVPLGAVIYAVCITAPVPNDSPDKMTGIVFIGMTLLLLLGMPRLIAFATRRNVKAMMRGQQNSVMSESVRVLLLPDELHITTPSSHNGYRWNAVLRVTEIPTHYFFWISARNALIIPSRAFATPEQEQAFVMTAKRYREGLAPPPVTA